MLAGIPPVQALEQMQARGMDSGPLDMAEMGGMEEMVERVDAVDRALLTCHVLSCGLHLQCCLNH